MPMNKGYVSSHNKPKSMSAKKPMSYKSGTGFPTLPKAKQTGTQSRTIKSVTGN